MSYKIATEGEACDIGLGTSTSIVDMEDNKLCTVDRAQGAFNCIVSDYYDNTTSETVTAPTDSNQLVPLVCLSAAAQVIGTIAISPDAFTFTNGELTAALTITISINATASNLNVAIVQVSGDTTTGNIFLNACSQTSWTGISSGATELSLTVNSMNFGATDVGNNPIFEFQLQTVSGDVENAVTLTLTIN